MNKFKELFEGINEGDVALELSTALYNITGKGFTSRKDGVIKAPKGTRGWKDKQLDLTYKALKNMGIQIHGMASAGALDIYFTHKGTLFAVQHFASDGIIIKKSRDIPDDIEDVSTEAEFYKAKGY